MIERKHITPYLPYKLKWQSKTGGGLSDPYIMYGFDKHGALLLPEDYPDRITTAREHPNWKPIFRTLDDPDLFSALSAGGISVDYDLSGNIENIELFNGSEWVEVSMHEYFLMLEKHADLYNLISQDLAIDMHSTK